MRVRSREAARPKTAKEMTRRDSVERAKLCQRAAKHTSGPPRAFWGYLTGGPEVLEASNAALPILTDYLLDASPHSGTVAGFVGSDTWITRYLSGCSMLALREMACNALGGS